MTQILENSSQIEFHTDMSEIIKPFKEEMKSLNWILSDQDFILFDHEKKGLVDKLDHEAEIIYFDGSELLEILENRKIQFIWGVFCGTKEKIENLPTEKIPYADLNGEIWTEPEKFLLPESEIEIICFDSSCTVVKFRNHELEQRWKMKFPEAKELKTKNAS